MENVLSLIRECALRRMKSHSSSSGVEIAEIGPNYKRTVHGNWMGLILISGADLRVTFKVHFDIKNVRVIIGNLLGSEPQTISSGLALDFIKEFCNLTAGYIKQILEEAIDPVITGISLPIVTKGFDDLFYKESSADEISEIWKIVIDGIVLYCTPHINIFTTDKLSKVSMPQVETATEDDGDIDFL